MLVNFKRPMFGSDGHLYGPGTVEVSKELAPFPKDAIVVSEDATLPPNAVPTKAGYGAKPEHEQVLDMIPGASPTHQITRIAAAPPIVNEEQLEARAEKLLDGFQEGMEAAKEMAVRQAEATGDPQKIAAAESINTGSTASPETSKEYKAEELDTGLGAQPTNEGEPAVPRPEGELLVGSAEEPKKDTFSL